MIDKLQKLFFGSKKREKELDKFFSEREELDPIPQSVLARYCERYLTGLNHGDLHETLMNKNWEEVDHVVKTYDLDPEGLIDAYYYSGFLYYHEKYGYIIEHLLVYHPYSLRDDPVLECSYNPVSKEITLTRFEKSVEEQAQLIKKDIERQKAFLYEGKLL